MKVKSFKEMEVWKKGVEIVDLVYEIISRFPEKERYGLSAYSTDSNFQYHLI